MIEITLKNYQSHKATHLTFPAGVNSIIGPSDSGKSAIIRAIKWLWLNRPLGDWFMRWGEKETIITLSIDGNTVERGKTKTKNWYKVNGKELKAMGTEVPPEVSTALALKPINWQSQRDLDFLLSLTPSEASRTIQGLCGLQSVPPIMQTLSGEELASNTKLKTLTEQEKEITRQLGKLEGIDDLQKSVEDIEAGHKEIFAMAQKIDLSQYQLNEYHVIREKKQAIGPAPGICNTLVNQLHTDFTAWEKLETSVNRLGLEFTNSTRVAAVLAKLAGLEDPAPMLADLRQSVSEYEPLPAKVCGLVNAVKWVKQNQEKIQLKHQLPKIQGILSSVAGDTENLQKLVEQDKVITDAVSLVTMLRADLRKTAKDLAEAEKSMPTICPTCGKPWTIENLSAEIEGLERASCLGADV